MIAAMRLCLKEDHYCVSSNPKLPFLQRSYGPLVERDGTALNSCVNLIKSLAIPAVPMTERRLLHLG